jgi:hypothetical protein
MDENILGALLTHRIYLFPNLSTPVDKEIYVALDVFRAFGISKGVDLDGHVIEAQPTDRHADAGFKKTLPVPCHQGFDRLG